MLDLLSNSLDLFLKCIETSVENLYVDKSSEKTL